MFIFEISRLYYVICNIRPFEKWVAIVLLVLVHMYTYMILILIHVATCTCMYIHVLYIFTYMYIHVHACSLQYLKFFRVLNVMIIFRVN